MKHRIRADSCFGWFGQHDPVGAQVGQEIGIHLTGDGLVADQSPSGARRLHPRRPGHRPGMPAQPFPRSRGCSLQRADTSIAVMASAITKSIGNCRADIENAFVNSEPFECTITHASDGWLVAMVMGRSEGSGPVAFRAAAKRGPGTVR